MAVKLSYRLMLVEDKSEARQRFKYSQCAALAELPVHFWKADLFQHCLANCSETTWINPCPKLDT